MAERSSGAGAAGRKASDFISALVKDPKNPPEIVEVTGYLGAAAEGGRARIYLDTTLQNYVEVEEAKILHTEPVAEAELGLTHFFLAADARIYPPPEQPSRLDARAVFGGAVYQDYLSAAGGGGQAAAFGAEAAALVPTTLSPIFCPVTVGAICPTHTAFCHTITAYCHTISPIKCHRTIIIQQCPTLQFICTHSPHCRTFTPALCTYHPLICVGGQPPGGLDVNPYAAMAGGAAQAALGPQAAMMQQPAAAMAAPQLPSLLIVCLHTIIPARCITVPVLRCPTVSPILCPPRTVAPWHCPTQPWQCPTLPQLCGWPTQRCPTLPACPTLQCPSFGVCPSIQCGIGADPVGPEFGMGAGAAFGGAYDPYAAYSTGG